MSSDRSNTADQPNAISWARFKDLWDRQQHDEAGPRLACTTIAVLLWLAALASILVAWSGAASRTTVVDQFPYFISGGLASVALSIMGAAVLIYGALTRRADRASENDQGARVAPPSTNSDRKLAGPVS